MKVLKYGGLDLNPLKLSETVTLQVPARTKTALTESAGETIIMPRIEAIHAGRTKNFVYYPADKLKGDASLKSGVYSWTDPYGKPVIYNHDVETEVTGRVVRAAYSDYTQAGKPGIVVIPRITEPKAVQSIRDGRLLTVSIGATTNAAICSICGTDIPNEGYCGHMKGEEYDGVVAEWIVGDVWFDELSWVNVPADENAMVVDKESSLLLPEESAGQTPKESKLNEYYNIPAHIAITESVALDELKEGRDKMDLDKLTQVVEGEETVTVVEDEIKDDVLETDAPEANEAEEVNESEEANEADEAEEVEEAEAVEGEEEADEETEAKDEPTEEEAESLDAEVATEAAPTKEVEELKATNIALEAQVEGLTAELREFYTAKIMGNVTMEEAAKEKFQTRLANRSLEMLKETLSDIEEGFVTFKEATVKTTERKVTKVESPVKVEEKKTETSKVLSEKDKINSLASLFKMK